VPALQKINSFFIPHIFSFCCLMLIRFVAVASSWQLELKSSSWLSSFRLKNRFASNQRALNFVYLIGFVFTWLPASDTHTHTQRDTYTAWPKIQIRFEFFSRCRKLENQISCPNWRCMPQNVYATKFMNIEKLNRNVCCAKSCLHFPLSTPSLSLWVSHPQVRLAKNTTVEGKKTWPRKFFFFASLLLFFAFNHFSNDGFSKF